MQPTGLSIPSPWDLSNIQEDCSKLIGVLLPWFKPSAAPCIWCAAMSAVGTPSETAMRTKCKMPTESECGQRKQSNDIVVAEAHLLTPMHGA